MENTSEKISILVHYAPGLYREGLIQVLKGEKAFSLAGVVAGKDLLSHIKTILPDILITGMHDHEIDVLGAIPVIRRKYPQVAVLAVSDFPVASRIVAMLNAGVLGLVIRDAPKSDIISAIRKVNGFEPYYSKEVIAKLAGFVSKAELGRFGLKPIEGIPDSDVEFLRLLCRGLSMKQISASLQVRIRTLEHRKRRLFEIINTNNTAGLINYAIVNGIYDPFEAELCLTQAAKIANNRR